MRRPQERLRTRGGASELIAVFPFIGSKQQCQRLSMAFMRLFFY